jgi:transposase
VRLLWAKRVWRCPDPDCPGNTFTEEHPLAGPRAKLTARAVAWATDALQRFDTSVSALAHQLGVSWHTVWDAIKAEAREHPLQQGYEPFSFQDTEPVSPSTTKSLVTGIVDPHP